MKLDFCSQHVCQPRGTCSVRTSFKSVAGRPGGSVSPGKTSLAEDLSNFLIPISALLLASSEPVVPTSSGGGPQST